MLVLLSDLHLTDTTTARNVHGSAFKLLGEEIAVLAAKKQATEVHLVLLGDILDLVRTNYWVRNVPDKERPWDGKGDPETAMNADAAAMERHFGTVLDAVLETDAARALIALLEALPEIAGTPPRVTYVIGNHDRMFHNYPGLKDRLRARFHTARLDFATKVDLPAPYNLLARHGHEWDENCHARAFYNRVLRPGTDAGRFEERVYRVQAIGEAVTAELMSGLVYYVDRQFAERHWDSPEDRAFLESFKDVNNLRPLTAAFNWLSWFLRGQGTRYDRYLPVLRAGLMDALTSLLRCRLARQWDKLATDLVAAGDLTDHLGRVLCLVKQKQGLKLLEGLVSLFEGLQGRPDDLDALARGAREELLEGEAQEERYQYLVYGHTHEARQDCFRAGHDQRVKFYVNTGTFLPFVERAREGRGFWTAHRMTYAVVFHDGEDRDGRLGPGPTLDVWNGLRRKLTL